MIEIGLGIGSSPFVGSEGASRRIQTEEIPLAGLSGDQWQPLGSDATGGISTTAERSEWPTVNTRGDSVLVKWNQVVGTDRAEVYLVELQ